MAPSPYLAARVVSVTSSCHAERPDVMPNEVRHLDATLTTPSTPFGEAFQCHAERSEASGHCSAETPHSVRGDEACHVERSDVMPNEVRHLDPAPGVQAVTLELDLRLPAQPGQFIMLWLPRLDEKPFSLVDDDPVTLTVVRVGPFTEKLQSVAVGDRLYLRGPFGSGFTPQGERPLLVAGGSGVAPLAFLCQRLRQEGYPVTVTLGARSASGLLLAERFQAYGAQVDFCTEDGSAGERGLVTDLAARLLDTGQYDSVYACGPAPMLERVAALCRERGVPGQVSREAYMRCGIGICGSCTCGEGHLVCRDGPVFQA